MPTEIELSVASMFSDAVSQSITLEQIELATQSADEPPTYTSPASLDAPALAGTGLTAETLSQFAQSHCRFE